MAYFQAFASTQKRSVLALFLCAALLLSACGKEAEKPKGRPPTVVTTEDVKQEKIAVVEETVGQVDPLSAPFIAAEVAGRVVKVHVDVGQKVGAGQVLAELDAQDQRTATQAARAEVKRVEALLVNQRSLVERYRKLVDEKFISPTAMEKEESQLVALREQLVAAKSQLEGAQRNLKRTRVTAPVAGRVEQRLVSVGDFVPVGKAMFRIATSRNFRVHLPFPETVAPRLRIGLPVRLSSPAAPEAPVEGQVSDIRPMIGAESRAVDVIVDVPNPGAWVPGASVNAAVIIDERQGVSVPEMSVVQRPAGEVVYVVKGNVVEQRTVKTGVRREGRVEILSGVQVGEHVVVDGAAFLTDKAAVQVRQQPAPAEGGAKR